MSEFAAALKGAMAAERKTLMELGRALGISHSSIARWTTGSLPESPDLVGQCAMCFGGHWPATLVRAYLLDRCPPAYHYLLDGSGTMNDAGHDSLATPLERALEAIRAAAVTNPDLRSIVLDLGRLARGL